MTVPDEYSSRNVSMTLTYIFITHVVIMCPYEKMTAYILWKKSNMNIGAVGPGMS
jgi:hypothetical protein